MQSNWRIARTLRGNSIHVIINIKSKERRIAVETQEIREARDKGDYLQPIGRDKDRFFQLYPHMKGKV